jgi:hypothetical protein
MWYAFYTHSYVDKILFLWKVGVTPIQLVWAHLQIRIASDMPHLCVATALIPRASTSMPLRPASPWLRSTVPLRCRDSDPPRFCIDVAMIRHADSQPFHTCHDSDPPLPRRCASASTPLRLASPQLRSATPPHRRDSDLPRLHGTADLIWSLTIKCLSVDKKCLRVCFESSGWVVSVWETTQVLIRIEWLSVWEQMT